MMNNKKSIVLFYIVTALFWYSLYAYVPIFPTYVESKGISYSMVGIILGSYGFAQMILRIPIGILSDKFNRRKLYVTLGMLAAVSSNIGLWYFDKASLILLFRAFAGVAASMWVVYAVLFSSYFKQADAPKAMGFLLSVTTLGQVSATFTGGIVSGSFSDKHTFLLAAAAGIIGFFLSLMIKKEQKDITKEPVRLKDLLSVGKDRMLMLVSGLAILSQFLTFATTYGFTPVAASKLGASSYELGLLVTISALPGVISGALSGSFFGKRFGERNVITVGFMMTAASVLLIPFINSLTILFLTQIAGGFSKGMVFPLLMGMGIKNIPNDKRATAMGFYQAIYGLGMFLGPVVVGILTDAVSLGTGFVITAAIGFLAAVTAFLSLEKAKSACLDAA